MKRTPQEWAERQAAYDRWVQSRGKSRAVKREPKQAKSSVNKSQQPADEKVPAPEIQTPVAPVAPLVAFAPPSYREELDRCRGFLREIVRLSDPCLFITWTAIRKNIRQAALAALRENDTKS